MIPRAARSTGRRAASCPGAAPALAPLALAAVLVAHPSAAVASPPAVEGGSSPASSSFREATARAQGVPAWPPDQALEGDPAPPFARVGLSVDALAPLFGRVVARTAWAFARAAVGALELGAERRGERWGARLGLDWQLWPLARGLEGPWLGLGCGAVAAPAAERGAQPGAAVAARVEVGAAGNWRGVSVGVSAAVERELGAWGLSEAPGWRLSFGLHAGWVSASP